MTRERIPDEILSAAHARSRARAARDWAEADRLRAEIETAGWKIVDRGTDFSLSPAHPPDVADGVRVKYGASASVHAPAFQEIERQLALLTQEMGALKKEVAQFSALRNNLITRLDEAVSRAKEALSAAVPGAGDPLVEARRDRDMGVMKSTLSEILGALQRIEAGSAK